MTGLGQETASVSWWATERAVVSRNYPTTRASASVSLHLEEFSLGPPQLLQLEEGPLALWPHLQ